MRESSPSRLLPTTTTQKRLFGRTGQERKERKGVVSTGQSDGKRQQSQNKTLCGKGKRRQTTPKSVAKAGRKCGCKKGQEEVFQQPSIASLGKPSKLSASDLLAIRLRDPIHELPFLSSNLRSTRRRENKRISLFCFLDSLFRAFSRHPRSPGAAPSTRNLRISL